MGKLYQLPTQELAEFEKTMDTLISLGWAELIRTKTRVTMKLTPKGEQVHKYFCILARGVKVKRHK